MQIDVFTQVPHAFGWLTSGPRRRARHRARAAALQLPRHDALRAGQVDDEPYGGGAGMVLRVDVVSAALDAVYGAAPDRRVIALTPRGRPLTQAVVEELAAEPALTLLSSRFEGFDERIVTHLCSDAISIGPYVLSGGELPAMVHSMQSRRLPARSRTAQASTRASRPRSGGLEYPHYTRPAEFRGWRVPEVLLSGDHGRVDNWRLEQAGSERPGERPGALAALGRAGRGARASARARGRAPPRGQSHNPVDRLTRNLPHGLRVTIDWVVTIVGAVAIVLAINTGSSATGSSSSMEATLHCAKPASGCEALFRPRARQPLHLPLQGSRARRHRRLPDAAGHWARCGAGGTFVKRLVGSPASGSSCARAWPEPRLHRRKELNEPYIRAGRRDARAGDVPDPEEQYFFMGDNRSQSCDSREWEPCRART